MMPRAGCRARPRRLVVEGRTGHNGWVITGRCGEARSADAADALALYRLLEVEIVPAFYDRGRSQPPGRRAVLMKASLVSALPRFCARRSVKAFAGAVHAGIAEPG